MHDQHPQQDTPARIVRSHHEGDVLFGDRRGAARFIITEDGDRLVIGLEGAAARAGEATIVAPSETNTALELGLELRVIDDPESHWECDRWRAYHAQVQSPQTVFAYGKVFGVRASGVVYDAGEIDLTNTLGRDANAGVRTINQAQRDRGVLAALCEREGTPVQDPVCVGLDQWGIDIRARFGVLRVGCDRPFQSVDEGVAWVLERAGTGDRA